MAARSHIRYIFTFALTAVAALAAVSCSPDPGINEPDMPPAGAVLRLSTGSAFTRAEGRASDPGHTDGETSVVPDPYAETNEEKIDRVDLFFFDSERSEDAPFYIHKITRLGEKTAADLTVKVPIENIGKFQQDDNDKKVYIYALVNLPDGIKVDESAMTVTPGTDAAPVSATLANLHALKVSTTEFAPSGSGAVAAVPSSFVMRGGNTVDLEDGSDSRLVYVRGTIELERLASKIRLWAHIPGYIYVNSSTGLTVDESEKNKEDVEMWKPVLTEIGEDGNRSDAVKLYIYNIAQGGYIDGRLGVEADFLYSDVARANADQGGVARRLVTGEGRLTIPEKDIDAAYEHSHNVAYYSYPNHWDSGTPSEQHQTYVILTMPWAKVDKANPDALPSEYDVYYYQIPVNALRDMGKEDAECLEPNRYYRIKLNVGMLGSKDLGSALPVEASWEVLPWTTADVDVSVKPRRYLVVNQKEWLMNNIWTLEIPFSTSHPAEVAECYVTFFRYNDVWGTAPDTRGVPELNEFTLWLDAADNDLKGRGGRGADEGLVTSSFDRVLSSGRPERNVISSAWEGPWYDRYLHTVVEVTTTNEKLFYEQENLYYKKKYFYDDVTDSYLYYLGHEHPKTIQAGYKHYPKLESITDANERKAVKEAWDQYTERFGIDSVYTCTVDNEKNVIRFSHPLVQWNDVRETVDDGEDTEDLGTTTDSGWGYLIETKTKVITKKYKSKMKYYVPVLNPRTGNLWDEYSRCEIVIKIRHKDWQKNDDLYQETIHITQYPAMYVEVSHDYGNVYKYNGQNDGNSTLDQRGNQYILVNGHPTEKKREDNWGTSTEWFEATATVDYFGLVNNNPNMYVIHTSQLSEENEALYDLGDPRALYYNNDLSDGTFSTTPDANGKIPALQNHEKPTASGSNSPVWTSVRKAPTTDNEMNNGNWQYVSYSENIAEDKNGRYVSFYYPTEEIAAGQPGSKANFIAPVFRVASSLGKVSLEYSSDGCTNWPALEGVSRAQARRRCAAYQEAGRPAGRWRVPTMAEIKYLVQLSADEKIPHLFGHVDLPDMFIPYWSSTGIIGVKLSESGNVIQENMTEKELETAPAVRCIYDDWYWTKIDGDDFPAGLSATTRDFYWGDVKKDNTQTQSLLQKSLNKKPVIATDE